MAPVTTTEGERAEAFRAYAAEQLQAQTKSLDTIRSLMILWTLILAVGALFAVLGTLAG